MSARTFHSLFAALITSTAIVATPAQAATFRFDLPSQALGEALIAFSKQAGVKIVYPADEVRGAVAPAVRGTLTRQEALRRLIAGSGLKVVGDDGQLVALAQDTVGNVPGAVAAEPADEPEIVVTGYRESIEQSLQQKRQANAFIDVITAEDIGKFPDKNVADALQRMPGVVITRDGGEGSRVSIRGLQPGLTQTLLNGNFLAGADSGDPQRSFNFVMLPSNFIASTEVYKSSEARLEEGGIGGTIILNTRRPFDVPSGSGFISAEGTYSDNSDKFEPQIGAQYSWKNEAETVGFLIGGVYQKRTNREMRSTAGTWRWWSDRDADGNVLERATDVNGNPIANDAAVSYWTGGGQSTTDGTHYTGYWAPQSVRAEVMDQDRERFGIQATAQFRPVDNLTLTANYFRFEYSSDYVLNQLTIPEWGYGKFFSDAAFDESGTVMQSATFAVPGASCLTSTPMCTMETPRLTGYYSKEKQHSQTYEGEARYKRDRFEAVLKVGKTMSEGGPSMRFQVAAKPRITVTGQEQNGNFLSAWDLSNQGVAMEFSPELQQNLMNGIAQIDVGGTTSSFTNSEISQPYLQLDLTREFDGGLLRSIQLGGKWRKLKVHRETGRNEWYVDDANTQRYQDTAAGAVAQPEYFYDTPMGNINGGFSANLYPGINFERYLEIINERYGASVQVEEPNNVYDLSEEVWGGYAQLNFGTGGLRGNLGARLVHTTQTDETSDRLQYLDDYCVNGPLGPLDPNRPIGADGNCQILPLAERERIENVRLNERKTYTDFLPSLNVSYDVTPNLLLRGAVAKVVARPAISDLAGSRSLTYKSDAYAFDRDQFGEFAGWSGSGGNSGLKPFSAWQYDVGLEWYFSRGSVIGTTLFRKDVDNFIVPLVMDVTREVAGQQVLIESYSTVANGSSAVSQGVEVYAQHTLPFGLGAQVNFTYNDTSTADVTLDGQKVGTSPLVGSAKTQFNASAFYENEKLLLRASYNRRGTVVGGLSSGLNTYTAPYEQVDINASYALTNGVLLTASVINLTKSEEWQYLGNDTKARFVGSVYSGRRAYVGLSYNF
ncbi:TonB-dependent receptor [Sphingomonas sp. PL-96]|uniref:TonB-dependent receptor n=1 Tax=Sphingomonas sp. PL-96 TaxID=2887201 RepID=UPI001E5B731D|nr:TonB-dependent receptor [Sphingomonas sp. PL-96]MCC2977048.1 TonB-dependent receptor [Sphingomonas sp. PL-96]